MIAYFDCFSGISGDMVLGAFVDLGVPVSLLKEKLGSVPLSNFDIKAEAVSCMGIAGHDVDVRVENGVGPKNYALIESMIRESPLSDYVKDLSLEIFGRIADAEAKIHGCPKEKVHFHELGGIDAIVDIVGTVLCLEYLGIEKVFSSRLPLGSGFVTCSHGTLPVPAPATIAILKGIPVFGSKIEHELVTPTGAAIIASVSEGFGSMPGMTVENIGYGTGKHRFESMPNMLRVIIGQTDAGSGLPNDTVEIVETSIDDMNPEILGFLMDRLFEDGALDVNFIPVYMKKNRPGTMVRVLCGHEEKDVVVHRILSETSSLGVRYYTAERSMLCRRETTVETQFGNIRVKHVMDPDGSGRIIPEYEVCKKIAVERNIPLKKVYKTIIKEAGIREAGI